MARRRKQEQKNLARRPAWNKGPYHDGPYILGNGKLGGPKVVVRLAQESVDSLEDLAKVGLQWPFFLLLRRKGPAVESSLSGKQDPCVRVPSPWRWVVQILRSHLTALWPPNPTWTGKLLRRRFPEPDPLCGLWPRLDVGDPATYRHRRAQETLLAPTWRTSSTTFGVRRCAKPFSG